MSTNKIINPATGRPVKRTGAIGRSIINSGVPIKEYIPVSNYKIKLLDYGCNRIGMNQTMGTCWFNSIFNNFILSQKSYSYFMDKYDKLSVDEKTNIEKEQKSCPLELKKYHFYRYFYLYNKHKTPPKNFFTKTLKLIKTRNHAKDLINKLEIRSPEWNKLSNQGFDPSIAIKRIVPKIFESNEYMILDKFEKIKKPGPGLKFVFVAFSNNNYIDNINSSVISRIFKLDHVNIVYLFDILGIRAAHAISGYICNNEYYIFDSNNYKYYKIDWRNKEILLEFIKTKWSNRKNITLAYSYLCYIRL